MSSHPDLLPPLDGSHRERLLGAMADAIREQGFAQTTVADVVARARTSRRSFYQHFEDREACYLALFDLLGDRVLAVIAESATGDQPWTERVDRALEAYLGATAAEPELTRSSLRDLPGVGDEGWAAARRMHERTARLLSRLVEEAREHDPTLRPLAPDAALVIVGGFRELMAAALDEGRDLTQLHTVAGDLVRRITMLG